MLMYLAITVFTFFFLCAMHDFKLRAEHIAGVHNTTADAIYLPELSNIMFILFVQVS